MQEFDPKYTATNRDIRFLAVKGLEVEASAQHSVEFHEVSLASVGRLERELSIDWSQLNR